MILVTGVSGNVGSVVAEHLIRNGAQFKAGVRQKPKGLEMDFVEFDFLEPRTYFKALEGADKVFLMRPPAISNVLRDIKPFILAMAEAKVGHIVFLGADGNSK